MKKNILAAPMAAAVAALAAAAVIVAISWPDASGEGGTCADALSGVKGFKASDGREIPTGVPFFTGAEETETTLAAYAGTGLVVNFWATWCAPCITEMPSLAALKNTRPQGVDVLAVSEDRGGAAVAGPFLKTNGWENLGVAVDRKGSLLRAFGISGLPTTVLIDANGREAARLTGIAHWDSPEVAKILAACIAPKERA